MENKGFLTWEEAEEQAEYCDEYQEGVYGYRMEGKGYTLVEDGEVLIEGADDVDWIRKGVYECRTVYVDCGEVLIKNAEIYEYETKDGKFVKVNKNK
tara:strand:+ start:1029 stop:1319 length:291 start_codon:yes stop_codon:yes gene_type:complete